MASQAQKELVLIKALLREVVASCDERLAIEGSNPQIVKIREKAATEKELAEATIAALGGDLVMLKLYSRGL